LLIKGPRQVGKSSLLVRYLDACRLAGRVFALIDFQILSDPDPNDYGSLLSLIARELVEQLAIAVHVPQRIERQQDLTMFVSKSVIPAVGGPFVIAFDEVDRVLGRPYKTDFFSLLRMWHNRRSDPRPEWHGVDIALVISTEPYLLIDDSPRSPFNVSVPIELGRFDGTALAKLNDLFGTVLDGGELAELEELLGGQPFLTRLAYFRMLVNPKMPFAELADRAATSDGPFGDHLRSKLFWLGRKDGLLEAMHRVIARGTVSNEDIFLRLRGAGLVERRDRRIMPASMLYARFFKHVS
jgi:hypothetical protein